MADSSQTFIINADDESLNGRIDNFIGQAIPTPEQNYVRGDKSLAITIRPVIPSLTPTEVLPWQDDWATGDIYRFAIGLADQVATGGTFKLTFGGGTTGLTLLAYNISAANLQTPLSALSVALSWGTLTVTNPVSGVYVVTWSTANLVVPVIEADPANLLPNCEVIVSVIKAGNETVTTHAQQVISIRQQNVAYVEATTPLSVADLTAGPVQAGGPAQNSIYQITFDQAGTYGGLYSITVTAAGITAAVGQIGPLATAQQIGLLLANHPNINFQTPGEDDNVIVTLDGPSPLIEFVDDLSGPNSTRFVTGATVANPTHLTFSAAHKFQTGDSVTFTNSTGITPSINGSRAVTVISPTEVTIAVNVTVSSSPSATAYDGNNNTLSVTNVSLLAPTGVTGVLNLNTYNMAAAFWATTDPTITFKISIERERASGEIKTIWLTDCVVNRDIIDVTSLVPVTFPTFPTTAVVVNYNGGITDLTGLSAISTVGLTVPYALYYLDSTYGGTTMILTSSTHATSIPGWQRPADYAGGTNEKVWIMSI